MSIFTGRILSFHSLLPESDNSDTTERPLVFSSLGLLNDVFSIDIIRSILSRDALDGKDLEGNCYGLIEVQSRNFLGGSEKNTKSVSHDSLCL